MARKPRTKRRRRQGRGRLSTIDLLPEEADADIAWLNEELRDGRRLQTEVLAEFNSRLADKGIGSISKSAFSRYSVRKATQFRQLDETRRISIELAELMGADSADKMTIALSEMLKMSAFRLAESGDLSSKDVLELARAVQAVTGAQKSSADYRRKLEGEFAARMEDGADRAEAIAREAGLSAERIAQLRREFLGVKAAS